MRKVLYSTFIVAGLIGVYAFIHSHGKNQPAHARSTTRSSQQPKTPTPTPEPAPTPAPEVKTETQADPQPEKPKSLEIIDYTVKSGDTLSTIAQDHDIHVATITAENNLTKTSVLKIGQVLRILPIDALHYQVQSGDTLSALSKRYGIDQQAIVDTNSLDANASLRLGQWLFLPGAQDKATASPTTVTKTSSSTSTSTKTQTSGGVTWTADALAELNKIYLQAAKPVVKAKVEAYAREHGITVITKQIYLSIHV